MGVSKIINDEKLNPIGRIHDDGHIEFANFGPGWSVVGDRVQDSKGITRYWQRGNYIESYDENGKYQRTLINEGNNITHGGTPVFNIQDVSKVTNNSPTTPISEVKNGSDLFDIAGDVLSLFDKCYDIVFVGPNSAQGKIMQYKYGQVIDCVNDIVKKDLQERKPNLGQIMQEYEETNQFKYVGFSDTSKHDVNYNVSYSDFEQYLKRTANIPLQQRRLNLLGSLSYEVRSDLIVLNSYLALYAHKFLLEFCRQISKPVPHADDVPEEVLKDIYKTPSKEDILKKIDAFGRNYIISRVQKNIIKYFNNRRTFKDITQNKEALIKEFQSIGKSNAKLIKNVMFDFKRQGSNNSLTLGQLINEYKVVCGENVFDDNDFSKKSKYNKDLNYNIRYSDLFDLLNNVQIFIPVKKREKHITDYNNATPYEKSPISILNSWLTLFTNKCNLEHCKNNGIVPKIFYSIPENVINKIYLQEYGEDMIYKMFVHLNEWTDDWEKNIKINKQRNKENDFGGRSI